MSLLHIETLEEPVQCGPAYLDNLLLRFGPTKYILFQTLHPEAETVFSPVQDFNDITFSITKSKIAAGKKIERKPGVPVIME